MNKIFVYGTLKRGYNMERIAKAPVFLAEATLFYYKIFSLGGYPGITKVHDSNSFVSGEVWEVSDDDLRRLDYYEGSGYARKTVKVLMDDKAEVECFTYVYKYAGVTEVALPNGEWNR